MAGKPLIQHVYEQALATKLATIIIATDDERIQTVCENFGATVCLTSKDHPTGSDRLAEVVQKYQWSDDTIIVNLQGDEPLTPIENLYQVATNLTIHPQAKIATLATPIQHETEYSDANAVKVVTDQTGFALYFSRASIPFQRDQDNQIQVVDFVLRHLGIYAYRAAYLKQFSQMAPCALEKTEKLEQLRAMWYGQTIHVDIAKKIPGHGVDTEEDLQQMEKMILKRSNKNAIHTTS